MTLIFNSYAGAPEFTEPAAWLHRIEGYTGILESMAPRHQVIGIERINYEGQCEQNGVQYHFIKQKKKIVRFPLRIHGLIKKLKPDVVFINGFIFPLQLLQLRLTVGRKTKIIVINRSEKPGRGIKKYLQKLADKCVNAYLFTSLEFGHQWVQKGIISRRDKIHEVFHGSSVFKPGDKEEARALLTVSGSPVYLWVGRLDANKDPLTAIKAFSQFLEQQPSATLYMIYHTEELEAEIRKLIEEDELAQKRIRLVGKVPHQQLQMWYNAADFFISASHYEGGGISVCEAMSCGCVPIITDIDSFRILTGQGKCGILYEPGSEQALLHALQASLQFDLEKERDKTLDRFREHLSFEAIGKKIEVVISR
ncbi:MAG: glycosyltransferase family 4 protein [Chitinophagaceae bacterium]